MSLNRYKLAHLTLFSYDGTVSESSNELRLRPRHDETQSCLSFRLTTTPFSKPAAHLDYFGNWVHQFHILPEHRELRVESEAVVLVHQPAPQRPAGIALADLRPLRESLLDEYYDWLSPTRYCPLLPVLADLVAESETRGDGAARGFAEAAASLIHERFTYKPGATHVHSSLQDCLETRSGVCQDFSHLLLAVLRLRGLP